ncbi:MAG: VpaChn25_0724 family phage protein [Panacagrimonas sp.]
MSFREAEQADRRLVILRLLELAPGYECNSSVLQMALEQYGHNVSRDLLHTDLSWLAEQGLLTARDISTLKVCELTARGADVARGKASVPGVKKPSPGL